MKSLRDLANMQERVVLVTGGAGHIGAVIGETLAELGARIVVLDMVQQRCNEVADQIHNKYKVETLPLTVNLAKEQEVRSVSDFVLDHFGRLDILINCASLVGISKLEGWAVPFLEQSLETWKLALDVNLTAPFILTQMCTQALTESGNGSVINVSSIYGMVGPNMSMYEDTSLGNPAAYAASKGGLLQFTRWLATVLAPSVRVNAITLGGVWRDQSPEFLERYVSHTPLRRMATEEDVKGAVSYLASDLSSYVTGHNLVIDGGWTTW